MTRASLGLWGGQGPDVETSAAPYSLSAIAVFPLSILPRAQVFLLARVSL